jgi:hypothetical protein
MNIYELDKKILKEIQLNSYILDVHQNIFSSTVIKEIFPKTPFHGLNGHILMYATNNKDLFFSILKKINLYYFICYEQYLFFDQHNEFCALFQQYNKNFNEIFLIINNIYLINIYILINNLIFKIILII